MSKVFQKQGIEVKGNKPFEPHCRQNPITACGIVTQCNQSQGKKNFYGSTEPHYRLRYRNKDAPAINIKPATTSRHNPITACGIVTIINF